MGKGDKKSKKGKITMGSYGNSRPHSVKKKQTVPAPEVAAPPAAPAKAAKK